MYSAFKQDFNVLKANTFQVVEEGQCMYRSVTKFFHRVLVGFRVSTAQKV